ncbi:MAG: large subunit ribosomal protein L25 [Rickettsiales bacterium]|jgi:large subunit ribosomal protein L25
MTSNFNLKANLRTKLGSSESRRIRKAGHLPGIIRDKNGENVNIVVDSKEFEYVYFKGNILTSTVEIELDGKKITAISDKIELDPVSDRPIHVDFVPFAKDEEIKVKTKVKFTGRERSPGIKRGGFLHIVSRKVDVLCKPSDIPEFVEVDISALFVGAKIRSTHLIVPANVTLVNKKLFNVASILGRGAKSDEDKAAEGAEGVSTPEAAKK